MPKADPRSARKRQRSKGRPSAEALDEIDTLRPELIRKDQIIAQLQAELRTKDQTIDHLELKDRAKEKRMGDILSQHTSIFEHDRANWSFAAPLSELLVLLARHPQSIECRGPTCIGSRTAVE